MKSLLKRLLLWFLSLLEEHREPLQVVDARPASASRPREVLPRRVPSVVDSGDWDGDTLKSLDLVEFNSQVEPRAVSWLLYWLSERGPQRLNVVVVEVAYRFGVSTETAKRWIRKHSSEAAELQIIAGVVSKRDRG